MILEIFSNLTDSLILFQNARFTSEGRLVSCLNLFKLTDIFNLTHFGFLPPRGQALWKPRSRVAPPTENNLSLPVQEGNSVTLALTSNALSAGKIPVQAELCVCRQEEALAAWLQLHGYAGCGPVMPGVGWPCCCSSCSATLLVADVELEEELGDEEEEEEVEGQEGYAGAFGPSPVEGTPQAEAPRWQVPSQLVLLQDTGWGSWGARDPPALVMAPRPNGSPHQLGGSTLQAGRTWGPSGGPPAEPPGDRAVALSPLYCWQTPSALSTMGCNTEN
ncbi:uncharacterized protein LOC110387158 [Numida meleagris]|uniref:uncharacterized protein LOC110387158 n=1 Tax=Numida meleagris TaxID=8996 RepID=UPI000B3E353E|nr:uncharacterized protein LOC110387158 [Numida meleagris]